VLGGVDELATPFTRSGSASSVVTVCAAAARRAQLRAVEGLVGERRGAGDGGIELARPGLAEIVLEDPVDGVDVRADAGLLEGVERGADADVDLRRGVAAAGEREHGVGGVLARPLRPVVKPAGRRIVSLAQAS
jgi:hypothetical protein